MFVVRNRPCVVAVIFSFLSLSFSQLTSLLTRPGNPFIITFNVTNPTTDTISILKWNNVFDDSTEIPTSFSITDDQGLATPFASTYALRSGMYIL